jgi:hypothetical protein
MVIAGMGHAMEQKEIGEDETRFGASPDSFSSEGIVEFWRRGWDLILSSMNYGHCWGGRYTASWKRECKFRRSGPKKHLNDNVNLD